MDQIENHDSSLLADIVSSYRKGDLARYVSSELCGESRNGKFKQISEALVELHNRNEIDALSLIHTSQFGALEGHRFFFVQQCYLRIIPRLKATVGKMIEAVETLVRQGGMDLSASRPNVAFLEWLKATPDRAEEMLTAAQGEKGQDSSYLLTFAFSALADIPRAQEFARRYSDSRQRSALIALSQMPHSHGEAGQTLELLKQIDWLSKGDDLRSKGCGALFGAVMSAGGEGVFDVSEVLAVIMESPGPMLQYECTQILSRYALQLKKSTIARLLNGLDSIDGEHVVIRQALDFALANLFAVEAEQVLAFVKKIISIGTHAHNLSDLSMFNGALLNSELFWPTLLQWFLSGDDKLCRSLADLLQKHPGIWERKNELLSESTVSEEEAIRISRRAVGYLFGEPVGAACVLIFFLREKTSKASQEIENLLFDPLLLNYGSELRSFLEGIESTDRAYAIVRRALDRVDEYLECLSSVGGINELYPSEYSRKTERLLAADRMREAFEMAQDNSQLMNMLKRSTILYARRSTTYVRREDKALHPVDMDLQAQTLTFEFPRVEIIDPVGLDYRIQRLRRGKGGAIR